MSAETKKPAQEAAAKEMAEAGQEAGAEQQEQLSDRERIEQNIEQAGEEIDSLSNEIAGIDENLQQFEGLPASAKELVQGTIDGLAEKKQQLQDKFEQKQTELQEANAQLEALESASREEVEQTIEGAESALENINNELSEVEDNLQQFEQLADSAKTLVQPQIDGLEARRQELQQEQAAQQEALAEAQDELREMGEETVEEAEETAEKGVEEAEGELTPEQQEAKQELMEKVSEIKALDKESVKLITQKQNVEFALSSNEKSGVRKAEQALQNIKDALEHAIGSISQEDIEKMDEEQIKSFKKEVKRLGTEPDNLWVNRVDDWAEGGRRSDSFQEWYKKTSSAVDNLNTKRDQLLEQQMNLQSKIESNTEARQATANEVVELIEAHTETFDTDNPKVVIERVADDDHDALFKLRATYDRRSA